MLKKTHQITTLTATFAAINLLPPLQPLATSVPLVLGATFGSYLPDIDHPNTKLNHHAKKIGQWLAQKGHRGITHSLIGFLLIILPLIGLSLIPHNVYITFIFHYWLGLSFGYLCHLIEDNFSVQGVLWCYPFTHFVKSKNGKGQYKKRHWRPYYYHTGSNGETMIRWFFTLGLIALVIIYLPKVFH